MQQPLTCVEICAGAGGQALGLAMAGFVHVALVEYEEDYCKVLKQNRPEWNVICADITHNKFPLLIASPDSFLIAESRILHRIGIIGIKLSQMESSSLYKKV